MSGDDAVERLARRVLDLCAARGIMLATAESCTGGLIAAALTAVPGSSRVLDRGFVTYSNAAKQEMLGVSAQTLEAHGAVSRETALEMAEGALARSHAGLSLSVTGIAGPGGGTPQKPVGLVWFGVAANGGEARAARREFGDRGREAVRTAAVAAVLELAVAALEGEAGQGAA